MKHIPPPPSTDAPAPSPVLVMDSYCLDLDVVNDQRLGSYARQSYSPVAQDENRSTTDRSVIQMPAPRNRPALTLMNIDNDEGLDDAESFQAKAAALLAKQLVNPPTPPPLTSLPSIPLFTPPRHKIQRSAATRMGARSISSHRKVPHKKPYQATLEIHQSITSIPGLDDKAFEELRMECYAQSFVATGSPPAPCNPEAPWTAIPPLFRPVTFPAVSNETNDDVVMSTEPFLSSTFTFGVILT